MKQAARLTWTVIGCALMAAPNAFAGATQPQPSLPQPSQPAPRFSVRRFRRSSQSKSAPQFNVTKFERLTQPAPQFVVRQYQRPMRSKRRFVSLQRRGSRTNRLKNNMPTNRQIRTGRNRNYKRPERTALSRDPSLRISGRQRMRIRRHSRWAANR